MATNQRTNEGRARALASKLGVKVDPEEEYRIEVWTLGSGLCIDPGCHTDFAEGKTWAAAWADTLRILRGLVRCTDWCEHK